MTKLVLTFLVGVLAGSIGIQLQEQRVEERQRQALDEAGATRDMRPRDVIPAATNPTIAHAPSTSHLSSDRTQREDANERSVATNARKPDIPMTEAHEPLLSSKYDDRPLREWHEKLEREEKDMASYEKEQRLAEFFTPPHGIPFDVRSIECRKTICEIQAFALGPMQQNTVTQDLQRESWYDFSHSFINLGEHHGNTSVLIYLLRES